MSVDGAGRTQKGSRKKGVAGIWLTAILFLIIAAVECSVENVWAAETNPIVTIDTTHVYDGMEQSFAKGYAPVITGNRLRLVVPFVTDEELQGKALNVGVEFEGEKECPFSYKNYQKKVSRTDQNLYLYDCKLRLKKDRINGQYPITLTVTGRTTAGTTITNQFTIYVEITDGSDPAVQDSDGQQPDSDDTGDTSMENGTTVNETPVDETKDSAQEPVTHQPKLLLEGNSLSGKKLETGSSQDLTITVRNCSKTRAIENAKVTITTEETGVTFAHNSFYYERVAAGQTMDIEDQVTVGENVMSTSVPVQLVIEYDDAAGTAYSTTESMTLLIAQTPEVALTNILFPESVYGTETDTLTLQIENSGHVPVYQVKVTVQGDDLTPAKEFVAGTIEAGSVSDGEVPIYVKRQDADKYAANGTIVLSYKDGDGQEYRQECALATTVLLPQTLQLKVEEKPKTNQWWITIVVVLILALILVIIAVYVRMKYYKKRVLAYEE